MSMMTPNLLDLSAELLDRICSFVHEDSSNSLNALSLSCKLLCDISAPHLFVSIKANVKSVVAKRVGEVETKDVTFAKDMARCDRLLLTR